MLLLGDLVTISKVVSSWYSMKNPNIRNISLLYTTHVENYIYWTHDRTLCLNFLTCNFLRRVVPYLYSTIHNDSYFTPFLYWIQRNKCYEVNLFLYNFTVNPSFFHGKVTPTRNSVSISIHDDTGNFWGLQVIVIYHLIIKAWRVITL